MPVIEKVYENIPTAISNCSFNIGLDFISLGGNLWPDETNRRTWAIWAESLVESDVTKTLSQAALIAERSEAST